MKADELLDATLKALNLPVSRAFRKVVEGKPAPHAYFTYQLILGAGAAFADDDTEATETTWRIDLFSKSNYASLIPQTVHALKAAEFYGVTVEAEQYEQNTGYYHVSLNAKFMNMEAD